jgi:elongation factor Ts
MANYTTADLKRLRELTGAGMMACKKALDESDGDFDKAVEFLRIKGAKDVGKRAERTTANGLVAADGGVMIELNCETDFVAKTEAFERLAKDIAMHISFADPRWKTRDEVPQDILDEESAIYAKQAKDSGKPENVIEKIVAGKLESFYKENVLLDQEWIQDKNKSIQTLLDEAKSSMSENVTIGRFCRIRVGENS